jgi:hypothetical protein
MNLEAQFKRERDFKKQVITQCNRYWYIRKQTITQCNEEKVAINKDLAKVNSFSRPWQVFL